jgi:hypothetical protein
MRSGTGQFWRPLFSIGTSCWNFNFFYLQKIWEKLKQIIGRKKYILIELEWGQRTFLFVHCPNFEVIQNPLSFK